MAKLTLKAAQKAIGIGTFVEKTIKFRDIEGNDFEGEVLIKALSSDEVSNITDVLGLKEGEKASMDQYRKAMLKQAIYEDKQTQFFPDFESFAQVTHEFQVALYNAADEVINFSGKFWISMREKSSGVNSSSTESVAEQ
ncbi:hypothetical protein [Acinetobacter guillouiae]|uniref:hypothetical protein n=1 Tax=Acinetobacter guillouiae TaxID=106649 RepID=UPI002FD9D464